MKNKIVLILVIIFCISSMSYESFAADDNEKTLHTITIDDAYELAINAAYEFNMTDKDIYDLIKDYGAQQVVHDRNEFDMQNEFNSLYTRLKSGQFLQSYEQGALVMYYAVFKDSKVYGEKDVSPQILPYRFANCGLWVSMMQMKISNELRRTSLINNVKQLYDNLIAINDNISILEENTKVLELERLEAIEKYRNGQASKLEEDKILSNYEVQKLELNKQIRNKENAERELKKVLGVDLYDEIQVEPYEVSAKDIEVPSYEDCISEALLNRNEIAQVKMNLITTQNQIPMLDKYLHYMRENEGLQMSKKEALLRIDELNNEIKMQEELVTRDINTAYAGVTYQKKSFEIEKSKIDDQQKSFEKAKKQYELGQISNKALLNVKIEYLQQQASYDKALRELAGLVRKLGFSCNVG